MYHYEVTAHAAAPPETVFAILADAPGWKDWAGLFTPKSSWEREGVTEPGGVGAIRKLGAPPMWSREEIVAYDPPHHLGYVLLSGLPVRHYRADVHLTPDTGGTGTSIRWGGHFEARIPGTGPLFLAMFRSIVGTFAKRLAAAASVAAAAAPDPGRSA